MKRDSQIVKDVGLAAVEVVVSMVPPLALAWGMSKALYGAGLKLRSERALEWVEMVRDNSTVFTEEILQSDEFQDGFVYALEQYIKERSEQKRLKYKQIFLGFVQTKNKETFELERFYMTLQVLDESALDALQSVDLHTPSSYCLYDDERNIEGVYTLIHAGIIIFDTTAKMGPLPAPYVFTTSYGRRFILNLRS